MIKNREIGYKEDEQQGAVVGLA